MQYIYNSLKNKNSQLVSSLDFDNEMFQVSESAVKRVIAYSKSTSFIKLVNGVTEIKLN